MKRYYQIIEELGLEQEFKIYLNSKSVNAPYHNLWHTINMIEDCYAAINYFHEADKDYKDLIIAAIFHDINHTQGKCSDATNIQIALDEVNLLPYDTAAIANIIRATQYPYVIPVEQLSYKQKIIRDADLMSSFKNTLLPHCLMGLSKELNISFENMIDGQEKFIENSVFNTEWGKEQFKKYIANERAEMKFLRNIV